MPLLGFLGSMSTGLFIIAFFYLSISIGAVVGLFQRRDQLPRRRR